MSYHLFIDDERFPPQDGNLWLIARSLDEVREIISANGWPIFVSFDHDLGDNVPSGMDIAHWMVEYDLDHSVIPRGFAFYVHSQNPVGRDNIQGLLDHYLRVKFAITN